MAHDTGGAWRPLFNSRTSRTELDHIIAEQVQLGIADVLARLEVAPGVTESELVMMHAEIRAYVERRMRRVRRVLVGAWQNLQLAALPDRGAVH